MQAYSDSEKICQSNNASMVSIHYAEEQNFLKNYIFTKKKAVDNVWIGAKYLGNKLYQWEDGSQLAGNGFNNWAAGNPKNLTDHCVEMLADEGPSMGKWADERCEKRNMVVCQRMPPMSVQLIAATVIELKHSLQMMASSLAENKKEIAATIPIGFTYVQLPKDKPPSELWPSMTWADVSKDYEGVFFRVVGGDAASFGQLQQGNAPRLGTIHSTLHGKDDINTYRGSPYNLTIPMSGWSDGIFTGSYTGANYYYMNFKLTDTGEVRPKNMAIKVYKRTA